MYQEKISALETLNNHKSLGKVNWITFRNESGLILDPFFDATIEELKNEGFLLSFTQKQDDYHFQLSLKGIHYKDVLKDMNIEKNRVRRAEIVSYVSGAVALLTFLSKFLG